MRNYEGFEGVERIERDFKGVKGIFRDFKGLNPFCPGGVKLTRTFFEHSSRPNGQAKVAEIF